MRLARPDRTPAMIGLTPLIDVVFILLIFFMLATRFSTERAFDIGLASGASAPGGEVGAVMLRVGPEGVDLAGERLAAGALARRLETLAQRDATQPVVVLARAGTELQDVVAVLDLARRAGLGRASLGKAVGPAP